MIGFHTGKKGNRLRTAGYLPIHRAARFLSGKIAKIIRFPYGRKNGKFSIYQKIPIFGATNPPGSAVIYRTATANIWLILIAEGSPAGCNVGDGRFL
jgi:hypothetical protein